MSKLRTTVSNINNRDRFNIALPHGLSYSPRLRLKGIVEYLCCYCGDISQYRFGWGDYSIVCCGCKRVVIVPGFRILIPDKKIDARSLPAPRDMIFPNAEVDRVLDAPYSIHKLEID